MTTNTHYTTVPKTRSKRPIFPTEAQSELGLIAGRSLSAQHKRKPGAPDRVHVSRWPCTAISRALLREARDVVNEAGRFTISPANGKARARRRAQARSAHSELEPAWRRPFKRAELTSSGRAMPTVGQTADGSLEQRQSPRKSDQRNGRLFIGPPGQAGDRLGQCAATQQAKAHAAARAGDALA